MIFTSPTDCVNLVSITLQQFTVRLNTQMKLLGVVTVSLPSIPFMSKYTVFEQAILINDYGGHENISYTIKDSFVISCCDLLLFFYVAPIQDAVKSFIA